MDSHWRAQFDTMSRDLFDAAPNDPRRAREFYRTILGSDAVVALTIALRLDLTEGGQDWALEVADQVSPCRS